MYMGKCYCGKILFIGSFITEKGNEIEYEECEVCGIVDTSY